MTSLARIFHEALVSAFEKRALFYDRDAILSAFQRLRIGSLNLAHFAKTFAFFAVKRIKPQRAQRIRKGRKKTKCMITCLFHVTKQ
jgi:hypothetical protein